MELINDIKFENIKMLKYEQAFHFNDYYEKYQKSYLVKFCVTFLESTVWYTALFYLLRLGLGTFGEIYAWKYMNTWFVLGRITFVKVDLIYYVVGLLIIYYASFQLNRITLQNHSVKAENNKMPKRILKDGYYAKKRHPMYGTFLFLYIGVLLSLRSLNGILLALLLIGFQYINAMMEERIILKTELKFEYQQYKREVKRIFFDLKQRILIIIIFVICSIGFIF